MTRKPRVLITGASGLIGRLVVRDLSDRYAFSGLSRRPVEGIPHTIADITDLNAVRQASAGMDMVLHLAAETEDYDDWDKVRRVTMGGTLNMYRAAQEAGVKRVVFASAGSTMIGYEWYEGSPYGRLAAGTLDRLPEGERMLLHTDPPRPDTFYSVGKLFGEHTGRLFSDRYGMSVLVIRVGAVLPDDKPSLVRELPGYLSHRDLVSMIDKCLSAPPDLKFDIFHAISENARRWRDTDHAKRVLGWTPVDSSDVFDAATLA
ncbi:NAD-dependent epimerase/dehydratase family protein [Devosia sp.]|uniref:NAD-dependent epimerase/dehydratase family protein n=1 Tax=Devosia sp. TaxID=1871048 RepID=UPI0035B0B894